MSKRMWMLLLGASVLATCFVPALAQKEEEVTQAPTEYCGICEAKKQVNEFIPEWFTYGIDHRLRMTHHNNALSLIGLPFNDSAPGHDWLFMRNRTRLWGRIEPIENVEIGARLIWEWFMFCRPKELENTPSSDAPFDELYVKWINVLDMPLTFIGGRQNMRLGDGWLVFEGTPGDGSRTIYFDAFRFIYDLADYNSKINAILAFNRADRSAYLKPINGTATRDEDLNENDETAAIIYVENTSQENMQIDGYYIYVHREQPSSSNNRADLHTIGGRVAGDWSDNWAYRAEAAIQFGNKERVLGFQGTSDVNMCLAGGVNARVTYLLQDALDTALHCGYEYRSGDSDPDKNFDILFARYPSFSELLQGYADRIEGRAAGLSNFHRLNLGAAIKPFADAVLLLDWHILFADNANLPTPIFGEGCLRGNLFTGQLRVVHSHHMASTITAEVFLPGDFYSSDYTDDWACFSRYELQLTW